MQGTHYYTAQGAARRQPKQGSGRGVALAAAPGRGRGRHQPHTGGGRARLAGAAAVCTGMCARDVGGVRPPAQEAGWAAQGAGIRGTRPAVL
jgi:hypothetical protein